MAVVLYDCIIIGAGPAGASAARAAAQNGLLTLLIDKDEFPREKPCGGAVSARALKLLDFELPEDVIETDFFGGTMCYEDMATRILNDYRAGVLVTRSVFDNLLMEKAREAGAETALGERVLKWEDTGGKCLVHTDKATCQCRFLIIAEGCNGKLKRGIRPSETKDHFFQCVNCDVPLESRSPRDNTLVIRFGPFHRGYAWDFPRKDVSNVGVGDVSTHGKGLKAKLKHFLKEQGFPEEQTFKGHCIPLGGYRRRLGGGRVLLAGDAGGFADALLGEGIQYAIHSGQIAASTIARYKDTRGGPDMIREYERVTEVAIGKELRHTLHLSWGLKVIPRWLFRQIVTDKQALTRYIDIMAGRKTYESLNRWMLLQIPRFVWKAVRYLFRRS